MEIIKLRNICACACEI